MTLSETIGTDYYKAAGLQTNLGSTFALLPGKFEVALSAVTTDWNSTGIAALQLIDSAGNAINAFVTTAANSRGTIETSGGQATVKLTAPAANVNATVARIREN